VKTEDRLQRIRDRLRAITTGAPVAGMDGLLIPSFEPTPDSMLGREYAKNPEYARRSRHNYAVFELWGKIPCASCGRPVTNGWGILPDPMKDLLDPKKPPKLCYACSWPPQTSSDDGSGIG